MKKRRLILLLIIVVLAVPTHALTPRYNVKNANLTFNGRTAICSVVIKSTDPTASISATITLSGGGKVTSWTESGTGEIDVTKKASVTSGVSYTLTVNYKVNGESQSAFSNSATCP